MKILAIRLKNLASLAGPVALDFTAEPLASAGLFAITGPTGAGKSTLLDALCLALFGAVPRLGSTGRDAKVPDGEHEIATGDPRNLLRRGAGMGYAEVDFIGVDGVRYRARWEANRARDKAGGKLQPSRQTLQDLDSERLLATQKGEYRPLLEARLGLNFEQFTRAVLLAQSEFSAFLKADDNERSELLEKLTDTALYSRLGRRAYDKARSARQQLEALQAQEGAFAALDDDARLALDNSLSTARQALSAAQAQRRALQHQRDGLRLATEAQAAEQELAAAEQQWQQLEAERQDLAHLEALAPQRPVLERQKRLTQQLHTLTLGIAEANSDVAARQQAADTAQTTLTATQAALDAASTTQINEAPALRLAFEQHSALRHLEQQLAPLQARQGQAEQQYREAERGLAELTKAQREGADVAQAIDTRLEASAPLARLASAWQAYQPRLHQLVKGAARKAELASELPALRQAIEAAREHQAGVQAGLDELNGTLGDPRDLGERLQLLSGLIRDNRSGLEGLGALEDHWRRWAELEERLAELNAQQQALAEQRQARTTEGKSVSAEHQAATQALDVTVQVLERQHLARLRAGLVPGEPCTVCGSPEHPVQGQAADTNAMAQALEAQGLEDIEAAQAKVQGLSNRLAELRAEVAAVIEQQKQLRVQQQRLDAQQAAALEALKALPRHDELLATPAPRRQAWLTEALGRVRQQIDNDDTQLKTLLAAQAQATGQLEQSRLAQQAVDDSTRALHYHQEQLQGEEQRFDEALQAFATLLPEDRLQRLRTAPGPALADVSSALDQRLRLLEQQQAQARAQEQRQQQVQVGEAQLKGLAQQREGLQADVQALEQQCEHARATLAEHLGGKPSADAWQAQLEQTVTHARAAHAEAGASLQQALSDAQAARSRHQALTDQQASAQVELAELEPTLLSWRQAHPQLSDSALERLLTLTDSAVSALREQIGQAHTRREQGVVLLRERQQQVQAHHAQPQPYALSPEALAEALVNAGAECERLEQACAEARAAQLEDDRRRQAREALAAQLAHAQAEHRRWGRLSALIGSAEGDRLRKIAQAYNLDLLIRHANAQLLQLVRRYRLKRGGSALGLLVVDTEMGDEVRSVHSLSGGETFLMSLALALGLASMASSTLRIESLFIDEGFGSLDPESLQLAMDALDNLQAQGRKVAVISHVQEMHERIPVQIQVKRQGNGLSEVTVVP
jgi:exonuclease SbcC